MEQRNFCIVGLGLLGGSYARGLTEAGCRVTAVDVRGEAIRFALDKGWIAQGTTEDARPLLEQAEAVVLGLYPHALIDWVRANARFLRPGTLVTDVCGVKQAVVGPVQDAMPEGVEFIASHPMAGKEVSGVEYADSAIFRPANFIITPTERNTPRGIAFARQLAETLGFAHRLCQPADPRHRRQPDERQRRPAPVRVHGRFLPGPDPHCPHQRAFVERIVPFEPGRAVRRDRTVRGQPHGPEGKAAGRRRGRIEGPVPSLHGTQGHV